MVKGDPLDSTPNSWIRLGTILHEARHTDGQGSTATFPHVNCDNGYSTKQICDNALNGPNAVAKAFLTYAISLCSSCSQKQLETLRAMQADVKSRVNNAAGIVDITPSGT